MQTKIRAIIIAYSGLLGNTDESDGHTLRENSFDSGIGQSMSDLSYVRVRCGSRVRAAELVPMIKRRGNSV